MNIQDMTAEEIKAKLKDMGDKCRLRSIKKLQRVA